MADRRYYEGVKTCLFCPGEKRSTGNFQEPGWTTVLVGNASRYHRCPDCTEAGRETFPAAPMGAQAQNFYGVYEEMLARIRKDDRS